MRSRISILMVLAGFATACSQLSSPSAPSTVGTPLQSAAPAPIGAGATISGAVIGNVSGNRFTTEAAGLTVTVVGTSVSAAVDGSGQFTLRNTPTGQVQLRFTGSGVDALLTIAGVGDRDEIRIIVRVAGATAEIENHRHESPDHHVEIEGRLTEVNATARTLRVGDALVNVPAGVSIRRGNTAVDLATLHTGDRVRIKGTANGSLVVAAEVVVQTGASGPGGPDAGDDDEDDDDDDDDEEHERGRVELTGALAGLTGTCPSISFTVSGAPVATSRSTDFHDGACTTLKNGDRVEVEGAKQANGTVLAGKVEKKK